MTSSSAAQTDNSGGGDGGGEAAAIQAPPLPHALAEGGNDATAANGASPSNPNAPAITPVEESALAMAEASDLKTAPDPGDEPSISQETLIPDSIRAVRPDPPSESNAEHESTQLPAIVSPKPEPSPRLSPGHHPVPETATIARLNSPTTTGETLSAAAGSASSLPSSFQPSQHPRPSTPSNASDMTPRNAAPMQVLHTPLQQNGAQNGQDYDMPDAPSAAVAQQDVNMWTSGLEPAAPLQAGSLDEQQAHQAYLMMTLAAASFQTPQTHHTTVTPSQVTLPQSLDPAILGDSARDTNGDIKPRLESFARIEFPDSIFQMTTYAVVIGRDQRALLQARRDEKARRRAEDMASRGHAPTSPAALEHGKVSFSKSYVSEEGGMLGPESDSDDEESMRPAKRRRTSAAGTPPNDTAEFADNITSNRQYISHTPGAAAVDLQSLRPSPHHVPFVGIHSGGPDIASKTKAISRQHLKIAFNQETGVFEAIPLHKNGFFCDDTHYSDQRVVLRSGSNLQIRDIHFNFIINGVAKGKTGAEDYEAEKASAAKHSKGGKEMSFDFEESHGNGELASSSDELSDVEVSPPPEDLSDEEEDQEEERDDAEAEAEAEDTSMVDQSPAGKSTPHDGTATDMDQLMTGLPRKRGPGRPPKNGIMSKREQRLIKKQQAEMAKKTLPQALPAEPPIKRKVGRPRKHPLPENGGDQPEKRKYKPRKPKGEDGAEASDTEKKAKEKKDKKTRPKSPPLELNREDYTEEQMQKPNKNYGVLIDEALSAAPDGLTLKQLYKRIAQKYPWFHFHTETKGWESSVRHNLIGNDAFKKDEATNVWLRVPGIELDAGKKRKATSPDRNQAAHNYGHYSYPQYNVASQHAPPGATGYPPGQMPLPSGYAHAGYGAQQQAQGPAISQYGHSASPPNHLAQGVVGQASASSHAQGYGPASATIRGPQQPNSYSSPYASKPSPAANHPIKTEAGASQPPLASPAVPVSVHASTTPGALGTNTVPRPGAMQQQQEQQQQLLPLQPQAAPAQTRQLATPPAPVKPIISPALARGMKEFNIRLIGQLENAKYPRAAELVYSAMNRHLGLKQDTEPDRVEKLCMKGQQKFINGILNPNKSPTPGADIGPVLILEPGVVNLLQGFINAASCSALKNGVGAAKIEAIALSAVDRVLGLADESLIGPNLGTMSTETMEKSLMQTASQLITGYQQRTAAGRSSATPVPSATPAPSPALAMQTPSSPGVNIIPGAAAQSAPTIAAAKTAALHSSPTPGASSSAVPKVEVAPRPATQLSAIPAAETGTEVVSRSEETLGVAMNLNTGTANTSAATTAGVAAPGPATSSQPKAIGTVPTSGAATPGSAATATSEVTATGPNPSTVHSHGAATPETPARTSIIPNPTDTNPSTTTQ